LYHLYSMFQALNTYRTTPTYTYSVHVDYMSIGHKYGNKFLH